MSTILITNAATSGVAVLTFVTVAIRRRLRERRVQRVYLTIDGRRLPRNEPL